MPILLLSLFFVLLPGALVAHSTAGGISPLDVHDADLQKVLSVVEAKINQQPNSSYHLRIGKVLKAESSIVSGRMYYVIFELGQTQCLKANLTKDTLAAACDAFTNVRNCQAKIWSQPWTNKTEILTLKCRPASEGMTPFRFGKLKISPFDKAMRDALAAVESEMSENMNSPFVHIVTKVFEAIEATNQVTTGVLYDIKFEFGQTKCKKSKPTRQKCRRRITGRPRCQVVILVQPNGHIIWDISRFHCD